MMKELLRLDHLSMSYGNRLLISDVSLTIKKGELLSISGFNNSGKTILAKTISGFLQDSFRMPVCRGRKD